MGNRMDRKSFLRLAGAGAAGAAALGGAGYAISKSGGSAAGSSADGPNIVVLMIDTLRYDHVGANGNDWIRTPNLDALARESLRFTRAFPEAMPTVPARRSMMSGQRVYPWHDWKPTRNLPGSPGWSAYTEEDPNFLRELRANGYWTGYVTDNPFLGFAPSWKALRRSVDRFMPISGQVGKREEPDTVPMELVRHWLPKEMQQAPWLDSMRRWLANTGASVRDEESCAARVYTHAADPLQTALANRPFALVVDSFDPHEPWTPTARYRKLYDIPERPGSLPGNIRYRHSEYLTADELERLPLIYAASVSQMDYWLGQFLDRLFDSPAIDDTMIVLLSDHGIVVGERGWTGKPALQLHPELIHTPFMLRGPGGRGAGETTRYFVSPHDVGPTALAAAGIEPPDEMNGANVAPLLTGGRPEQRRPFWYGGYANHFYYRDDRWAYVADGNNTGRRLYDLRADPGEEHNIAEQSFDVMDVLYRRVLDDAGLDRLPYYGREQDGEDGGDDGEQDEGTPAG